ncbi:MAG TPA: FkbM family methyltransferase [Oligoflexia bacterium]|nr:FkbM family methyltransferase [Oligoflexia bacterium]
MNDVEIKAVVGSITVHHDEARIKQRRVLEAFKSLLRPLNRKIRAEFKKWWRKACYAVYGVEPLTEAACLSRESSLKPEMYFLQIGAHDGKTDDHLREFVIKNRMKGILVEPVPILFQRLKENYRNQDGLFFENKAIAPASGTRTFYRLRDNTDGLPHWYDQLGSFHKHIVLKHKVDIPNIEDYLLEEQVECVSVSDLLQRYAIPRVDIMLIDCEGYDYEILRTIDFIECSPQLIVYEEKHLLGPDARLCRKLLRNHGYCVINVGANAVAVRRPLMGRMENYLSFIIDY